MNRRHRRITTIAIACTVSWALAAGTFQSALAATAPDDPGDVADVTVEQQALPAVPEEERDDALGGDWESSDDIAIVATGDATGFRVQRGRESTGYTWETIATLAVEGVETDRWIGNYCVTGDAKKVAVVYGTRTMTNSESLFNRGGYGALVDVETGGVTQLGQGFTLAYFSPSCGLTQQVVFTSYGDDGAGSRLRTVNADAPDEIQMIEVQAQVSSPVLTPSGLAAVAGTGIVSVAPDGSLDTIAPSGGTAYSLAVDSEGGLGFLDTDGETADLKYLEDLASNSEPGTLATAPVEELGLVPDAAGTLHVTGAPKIIGELPSTVEVLEAPIRATVSSEGSLALFDVAVPATSATSTPDADTPTSISAIATDSSEELTFNAPAMRSQPGAETGIVAAASPWGAGSNTNPVEAERTCAIPRNDPANQAVQPKPRQVEWAVDQAVSGDLTVSRPANWKNLGMPAYTPQGLFPRPTLTGGGSVPAQVMLGILAQESNLWQASRYTTPGVTGNPLIGNFYGSNRNGSDADLWTVNFANADCGYGVAQVTDGMRLAGREDGGVSAMPYNQQRAVALDFAANVAKGLQILGSKWNQTKQAGLTINDGDPEMIENWFFAVWAYNSGFYPDQGNGQPWGVGWLNNPANPNYPPSRTPFLDGSPQDAANPQNWPYPEKVMGFAAHSLELYEDATTSVPGFRTAYWLDTDGQGGVVNRRNVKPPIYLFCSTTINNCNQSVSQQPADLDEPPGPCLHQTGGSYDLKCWYHGNATWKADCDNTCGREFIRFDPGWAYQADASSFPPNCSTSGLPSGAIIVDNLPNATPVVRENCTRQATSGTFGFTFGGASDGSYPSKVDLHQLGAGFNGHFYFAHTRGTGTHGALYGGKMRITGKWTLGQSLADKWTRIMVHMPDHGAWTQQATYQVDLGNGTVKNRTILQQNFANKWVSLGVFQVNGTPSVTLSNETKDGIGYDDIAWDAVAFQPLSTKPADFVVAMGDSFSSGEGASPTNGSDYYPDSDKDGSDPQMRNACHRSKNAWPLKATLPSRSATNLARVNAWDASLDFQFIACSGAESEHLLPSSVSNAEGQFGVGRFHELSQIDRGFLDENTTLVTLSIGGNDARFGPILEHCIVIGVVAPAANCNADVLPPDTTNLEAATATRTSTTIKQSVITVLQQIRAKAPNAKILLMGYPKLFESGSGCVAVPAQNQPWLNTVSDALNTTLSQAATAVSTTAAPVVFANPQTISGGFAGKNLCTTNGALNGLVFEQTRGDGTMFAFPVPGPNLGVGVSQQSIHPNIAGATLYAQIAQTKLQGVYP